MRTLTLITLMAIGTSAPLMAMEHEDHQAKTTTLNTMCPMCDKTVGDKPTNVKLTVGEGAEAKTYLVACDSTNCAEIFMKNPEPMLKKTFGKEAAGAKTQYK